MMSPNSETPEGTNYVCARCGIPLKPTNVEVAYLDSAFPVDLLACHQCGMVLVTEDLAVGKMANVEKLLEDK